MKKLLFTLLTGILSITATAQIPNYVPTNGLVGWWPFNGNANDESGNGNNGTVNGATLTTDRFGTANKAYNFSQWLNVINLPELSTQLGQPNSSMTLSIWFKAGPTGSNPGILFHSSSTNQYIFGRVELDNGNLLKIYHRNPSSNNEPSYSTNNLIGQWTNVIIRIDGSSGTYQFYLNGVLIPSMSFSYNNGLNYYDSGRFWGIGAISSGYPNNHQFLGDIDDIGIWNRALTQQEITNLYNSPQPPTCAISTTNNTICAGASTTLTASSSAVNASACASSTLPSNLQNGLVGYWPFCGNANDASGNGNNGTVNGATLTTDRFGNSNSAYSFDGVNDYIVSPAGPSFINNNLTISFWQNIPNNIFNGELICVGSPTSTHYGVISNNNGTIMTYGRGCGESAQSFALTPYPLNTWVNVTLVSNVSNLNTEIYINGIFQGISTNSTPIGCNNSNLYFGVDIFSLPEYYLGQLDDIGIWNRALTTSEIQQLYNQGQTTYSWSNGATTPIITVSPTQTTTYTCTVTTNGTSCSSDYTVTVNPLPNVSAGQNQSVCEYSQIALNASGATSYVWDYNVQNGIPFTIYSCGGVMCNQIYTVIGTDANGCQDTAQVTITVNTLPNVNAGTNQTVCAGTAVMLSGSGANTYAWSNGVSQGVSFIPTASGIYTVTGTDANNCSSTAQVTVTVNALPSVSAGPDQELCQGQSTTLFGTGADTYSWSNNLTNGVGFLPTATQDYVVSGTNVATGCVNVDTVTVIVHPLPLVSAGADQTICKGDSLSLTGSGALSYQWNNNVTDGVLFAPPNTQTYSVSGTDVNGCVNTDDVTINVNDPSFSNLNESALDSFTLNGQTYTQSGTYTQVLTNAAGCDSTITLNLELSFTGINALTKTNIGIAPNPASEYVLVTIPENLIGQTFNLMDNSGRTILEGTFIQKEQKVDLKHLAVGMYVLKTHDGTEQSFRILKN